MEVKKITGKVEQITSETKSVKIDGIWFSGRFSYEGSLPSINDEVEMTLASSVSKKDNKTYWNITDIKVLKVAEKPKADNSRENSIIAQCLTKVMFNEAKTYTAEEVFAGYKKFLELQN